MAVTKRALLTASFFYACYLLATAAQAADCHSTQYDERVIVARVFDGDTVQLTDGRHLRFIAINTPERSRDNRPAEPLADTAKQQLEALLLANNTLLLRFDADKQDRHGRLLAHPYLHDGRNLTQAMLQTGLDICADFRHFHRTGPA